MTPTGSAPAAATAAGAPGTAAAPAASPVAAPAASTVAARPDLASLKIALEPVAAGLSNPLFVTHPGDGSGRVFVVEKTGAIRIIDGGKLLETPFLDIGDRITSSGSEQGLLGLAFPPDYATRKFFFVNYTNTKGDTVIGRYNVTADPNVADPASETVVLTFDQPAANHNGGDLAFGPDGYLWIGTGDGGASNDRFGNGQNPNTLLGKMLRLDVTSDPARPYVTPPDNPATAQRLAGHPRGLGGGAAQSVALQLRPGHRRPVDCGRRPESDRGSERRAGGCVGQPRAGGRPEFRVAHHGGAELLPEGGLRPTGPGAAGGKLRTRRRRVQHHGRLRLSRASSSRRSQGAYLYGDYCSGRIWALDAANPGQPRLLFEAGAGLSSFGEDEAGELYVTDLARGTVRRVIVP